MLKELSILIPTFNGKCARLVKQLKKQADDIARSEGGKGLSYEIIVADDGSTDTDVINHNKEIDTLDNCRYILCGHNRGRAAIRNLLAQTAAYSHLLFMDSHMSLDNDRFIENYLALDDADVAYGGYTIGGDADSLKHNLRYIYEKRYAMNHKAEIRALNPYNDFHTGNFFTRRDIMLRFPFDERFSRYGYEDVLWGKTLRNNAIAITHIDNPLMFDRFETNARFTQKTEEGIDTLYTFREELDGYSNLITLGKKITALHLNPLADMIYRTLGKRIKNNISGNKPSLSLFYLYKIIVYARHKT